MLSRRCQLPCMEISTLFHAPYPLSSQIRSMSSAIPSPLDPLLDPQFRATGAHPTPSFSIPSLRPPLLPCCFSILSRLVSVPGQYTYVSIIALSIVCVGVRTDGKIGVRCRAMKFEDIKGDVQELTSPQKLEKKLVLYWNLNFRIHEASQLNKGLVLHNNNCLQRHGVYHAHRPRLF